MIPHPPPAWTEAEMQTLRHVALSTGAAVLVIAAVLALVAVIGRKLARHDREIFRNELRRGDPHFLHPDLHPDLAESLKKRRNPE